METGQQLKDLRRPDSLVCMGAKDSDPQISCILIGYGWSGVLNSILSNLSVRLFHGDAPVFNLPIVDVAEVHGGDVFAIRIEDHLAGHALEAGQPGESVTNAALVQASATNGVEQNPHRIVCKRGEVVRLLVVASLVARLEIEPARIRTSGIIRIDSFKVFRSLPGKLDEVVADCTVTAEDALL